MRKSEAQAALGNTHLPRQLAPINAKSAAAQRGIPLRELVSEALAEKLTARRAEERPWMRSFGGLRKLHSGDRVGRIPVRDSAVAEPYSK